MVIILLIATNLVLFITSYKDKVANAATIEQYEEQISNNNNTISHYEDIKNQLHITAQLIRQDNEFSTEFVNSLSQKWHDYNNAQAELLYKNGTIQKELDALKEKQNSLQFLGYFTITHYSIDSCGKLPSHPTYGITATGTYATAGRTIAVDPRIIPYGSNVTINGHTYIAEDTGGGIKGNKIDICVSSNSEAMQKGVLYNVPVYIAKD